jgi:hypothetical protein
MKLKALLLIALLLGSIAVSGTVAGADMIELNGHVHDVHGAPLEGAAITIWSTTTNHTVDTIYSDANGNFSYSLPSGIYSIWAEIDTYRTNTTYPRISASTDHLNFTMYGLGMVSGFVTDGNTTLPGVKVTLKNSQEEFTAYTSSPWGYFSIENVTAGEYIATAEKLGYSKSTYIDPVTVEQAQTFELNFTMSEVTDKSAQLTGQVMFDNQPVEGVKISLVPLGGDALVTYTDAQGNYQFKGVAPGQYQLIMAKSGYIGTSQKVTLQILDVKAVDVVLKKDTLPGNAGFFLDYDLAHSLMIVALGLALLTTITALFVRNRGRKKPEMLEKNEDNE